MKKYLFLVLIYLLAGGIWSYWIYQGNPASVIKEGASIQEGAIKDLDPKPVTAKLSPYRGQDISEIGNDPIVLQVPAGHRELYGKELNSLKQSLMVDPTNVENWIRVGQLKKFFNNYLGARDAWEYGVLAIPTNPIPNYNLGGLYAGYLRNNAKAEFHYKEAVRKEKKLPYFYLGLADFYTVFYKEKVNLAEAVLLEGLKNNPGDEALQQALDIYKASQAK